MSATIDGPDFVALQVRDLNAAADFCEHHLGLRRAAVSPPHAVVFDTKPTPSPSASSSPASTSPTPHGPDSARCSGSRPPTPTSSTTSSPLPGSRSSPRSRTAPSGRCSPSKAPRATPSPHTEADPARRRPHPGRAGHAGLTPQVRADGVPLSRSAVTAVAVAASRECGGPFGGVVLSDAVVEQDEVTRRPGRSQDIWPVSVCSTPSRRSRG